MRENRQQQPQEVPFAGAERRGKSLRSGSKRPMVDRVCLLDCSAGNPMVPHSLPSVGRNFNGAHLVDVPGREVLSGQAEAFKRGEGRSFSSAAYHPITWRICKEPRWQLRHRTRPRSQDGCLRWLGRRRLNRSNVVEPSFWQGCATPKHEPQ